MNRKLRIYFLAPAFLFSSIVSAQISLPANTIATENFNGIGSSATATLPSFWKMSAAGTGSTSGYATGTNVTATTQAANSGLPSAGGRYNWATTAGTDRSIGFLTSGSYAEPNSIMTWYRNTTGASVNSVTVSFAIERFVVNTVAPAVSFYYSTDGTVWTAVPAGNITTADLPAGANAGSFTTPRSINKTVTVSVTIPNSSDIYVAMFNVSDSDQNAGIDFSSLGLKGKILVRDLWKHQNIGTFSGLYTQRLSKHASAIFRLKMAL